MISETAEQKQTRVYLLAKHDVALQWQLPAGARYTPGLWTKRSSDCYPTSWGYNIKQQPTKNGQYKHPKYYSPLRSTVLTLRFSYLDEVLTVRVPLI